LACARICSTSGVQTTWETGVGGRAVDRLALRGRTRENAEGAADGRVGVDPGDAALHDRNDEDPENDAAEKNADDGDGRPHSPGLIEDVRLGVLCHVERSYCTRWTIADGEGASANCAIG
jgi:hypothetical protein